MNEVKFNKSGEYWYMSIDGVQMQKSKCLHKLMAKISKYVKGQGE